MFSLPAGHELLPIHHDSSFSCIWIIFYAINAESNLFHEIFQRFQIVGARVVISVFFGVPGRRISMAKARVETPEANLLIPEANHAVVLS